MAEINLQAYGAEIEALLASGAADEASYHSRHILGQYPRYTPAFRLLGRALLLKGQLAEAEAAFRRVLSVEPDDISAHLGLSEIYDQRKRGDEAIWHAERAMETDIANAITTDLLRGLYRRYRGDAEPRMALTAVGLTRQALQNRDYSQAIATLRDALERHPERVDLRLLLAEALWQSGDHVTAGETAIDVLETLPDCFSANAIMTRLWLKEGRPSDAQPYLNRLEALDPYAAVEIASGQPADPAGFTLDVLDYQRTAQSDAARAAPDWLQGIGGETTASAAPSGWSSGMLATAAAHEAQADERPADDAPAHEELPAAETSAAAGVFAPDVFDDEPPELPEPDPQFANLFDFDAEPPALQLPAALTPNDIFAADSAELADFEAEYGAEFPVSDAFASPFGEREAEATPAPSGGATSPLPPLEEISPRPMPPAEDAMAWLRESGVELVDDEAPAFSTETGAEFPSEGPHDQSDPMAWLNTYDSALEDRPAEAELPPASTVIFEEGWEFDAEEPASAATDEAPGEPESAQLFTEDEAQDEPVAGASGALRGLTSRLGDPAIAATGGLAAAQPSAPAEAAPDEWATTFDPTPTAADAAADSPEWLTDLGAVMTTEPDATPAAPDEHGEPLPMSEAGESADWLNEFSPEGLAQDVASVPDALETDWLTELDGAPADVEAVIEPELPDWLMEDEPHAEPATEAGVKVPADDADVLPDWLIEPAPEAAADGMVAAIEPGVEELDWLNTLNASDAEPAADLDEAVLAAQADVPDWLDSLEAEALALIDAHQQPAAESAVADEEWQLVDAEVPAEPLPFDEAEIFAVAEVEPAAEIDAGLIDAVALAADALSSEQPELSPEDWGEPEQADLSRIAPPTVSIEGGEPVPSPDVAPGDWFVDGALAAEAPVPDAGSLVEMPVNDWFADEVLLAPVEAEAAASEWEIEPEASAAVTQLGADTLPYVASAGDIAAAGLGVLAVASASDEIETEAGEPAVLNAGDEDDEWLMTEWPDDADGGQLQPDELDALPDAEIAEETIIAPASNAPDWLNAMVPGLDLDYDAAGDEADELEFASGSANGLDETLGARSEYDWVIDLVEQEELETEAAPMAALAEAAEAPRFIFRALPAWFKRASEDGSDDDFADWPSDDSSLQAWQN